MSVKVETLAKSRRVFVNCYVYYVSKSCSGVVSLFGAPVITCEGFSYGLLLFLLVRAEDYLYIVGCGIDDSSADVVMCTNDVVVVAAAALPVEDVL